YDFDYAYHPFSNISDNTTHFFSIGYVGEADKWTTRVKLDNPAEHSVVYADHVRTTGQVVESNGRNERPFRGNLLLKINGKEVQLNKDNTFETDVPLSDVGKNTLKVEVSDRSGQAVAGEAHIMRLETFADLPDGYWAKFPIEANASLGTVNGFADGSFKPENGLSRADQVAMLVRAKGITVPAEPAKVVFRDVKPDFWAAKYIEIAAREGLVEGYPDKTFRPNNDISRVEGIVMTTRFAGLPLRTEVASASFNDLPADHWAAKYVEAAKSAGLIKFIGASALRPGQALTRAESTAMVSSTTIGTAMINNRFSW
ncbi:MAG TPA: S-layer homology domain-containing protein, partial [Candidatus Sulfotelmatobacter sp.]|nr:S-layer homology domain-containing protein [Candidatus Sulfotelmatobacter sp.]